MIRRSAFAVGALLGAFHLWLLGHQAWSGQLSDPATIARWMLAAALGAGLIVLRRRGLPVLFGRQAVAMWALAALLHGPALANDHDGFATPEMPEAVVTVAQAAASLAALGLALLAVWCLAGGLAAPSALVAQVCGPYVRCSFQASTTLGFLPRPPPLA